MKSIANGRKRRVPLDCCFSSGHKIELLLSISKGIFYYFGMAFHSPSLYSLPSLTHSLTDYHASACAHSSLHSIYINLQYISQMVSLFFCSHSLGFLHSLNHIRMYLHQLTRSRNKHYFIVYVCIFVFLHACMHLLVFSATFSFSFYCI